MNCPRFWCARIASKMTQRQLAEKLGLKPQQIQRYEATRYRTITLERILEVAEALGLKLQAPVSIG
jgi:transcriptional regulator with XRE-family HTH domain